MRAIQWGVALFSFILVVLTGFLNHQYQQDWTWIAFSSTHEGWIILYKMHPDGSDFRAITTREEYSSGPAFSPDGKWMAFLLDRNRARALYRIRMDGTALQPVVENLSAYGLQLPMRWSPDGQWILLTLYADGQGWNIYRASVENRQLEQLTHDSTTANAQWSPDGKSIAFISRRDGNNEIYVMRSDGSAPTNVSNRPEDDDIYPAWSPDGQWLAFITQYRRGFSIYTVRRDGSDLQLLFEDQERTSPLMLAWTPDGKSLLYGKLPSGAGSNYAIYRLPTDQHGATPALIAQGSWFQISPDDKWLLYRVELPLDAKGLYRQRLDSTTREQISPYTPSDFAWSPSLDSAWHHSLLFWAGLVGGMGIVLNRLVLFLRGAKVPIF